jgi:hypothetical protein
MDSRQTAGKSEDAVGGGIRVTANLIPADETDLKILFDLGN